MRNAISLCSLQRTNGPVNPFEADQRNWRTSTDGIRQANQEVIMRQKDANQKMN
jgi:hypothetical protein